MLKLYVNYWKKSFNYVNTSSIKEVISILIINFFILLITYSVGLIVPIRLENFIVDLWYTLLLVMVIPTVSLLVRLFRNYLK